MTTFYLLRHGEAAYDAMLEHGFYGFGRDLAPLSQRGIQQAEAAARDPRLKSAELLVSSPYTRAMQTAAIVAREIGLPITVDLDLHEWIPDKTNQYTTSEQAFALTDEFNRCRGVYPAGQRLRWETVPEMRERMRRAADRYAHYERVILVGHSMAFRALTYMERMAPAGIVTCVYERGQPDCPYCFR